MVIEIRRPMRDIQSLRVELSLRDIPPGVQKVLREIASGTRKLSDSKLLFKDRNKAWYWHLPVTFETEQRSDIEAEVFATIGNPKGRQSDRPFAMKLPGRTWYAGDGRYLLSQVSRLVGLRKQIGWRYRLRQGAGHGRKKVDDAVKRRREQEHNVRNEFRRRLIVDILRQCERSEVGKLVYREPSLPLREKCWFGCVGLEFDWTRFASDLKNAAARKGIVVESKQYKWKDAQNDGYLPKKAKASEDAS